MAQNVEFNASVSKKEVTVNEVFQYEIYTNTNCQIYQPNFGGLQVVGGPFQSTSTSIVSVNGQTSQQKETKYTYQLRALNTGTFTISKASMQCASKSYATNSIKVNVVKGRATNTSTSGGTQVNSNNQDFFIKTYASKRNVYQGEPFTVTLKMYSKRQPRGLEQMEIGSANGLTKEDLNPNKTSFETKQEVIDGMRYYTVTLKQELCFALRAGEIVIEPYYVSALFSKGFFQQYRLESYSNTIKINVKALPKGKPKDFNGLVGEYDLEHSISKTDVLPGEAIDISLKISGKGNLNAFDEPKLKLPNDFDQFDPEYKQNYKASSNGYKGSITYNLVIVPTFYGDYTIPAFSFSYFDLNTKKYKTLSTGDFKIHVNKPKDGYGEIITNKREVKVEENDIRFIHEKEHHLFKRSDLWAGSLGHIFLLILPFFTVWLILFLRKRNANLSDEDKRKHKAKKAKKSASNFLSESKKLQKSGESDKAVKSLHTALKAYLTNKFNLTESEFNLKTVTNQLNDDKVKQNLKDVWQQIEMYQYAPVSVSQLDDLIVKTEAVINQIENQKLRP
jgi:hypothetical protein